ncbi:MAG: heterodisulfide reductase-related iron-sulfur binding cluster [Desulfosarcinaceae bacterium]|nr:heterodisulfide reductase-related iron-sulfur binding cluster [Desulfosarcinaceae bacterium]
MKALLTSFDLLLIASALLIMTAGLARRWSLWRKKKPASASGDWGGLADALVKHRDILKRPSVGGAHLAAFWGVVIPLIVIIAAQFGFIIPQAPADLLSLVQDLAGFALLVGILYLMFRRIRGADSQGPARTLVPMVLLLIIVLSGFLAEGARMSILETAAIPWQSPAGWLFSVVSPSSPLFMQMMIRLHFFAVLLLIVAVPFTFMRHAAASPLNVFYRKRGPRAALTLPSIDAGQIGAKSVEDLSWKQMLDAEACVACGRCEENCPASISNKPLSPRKVIRNIREQMETVAADHKGLRNQPDAPLLETGVSADEMWACTSCMACVEHCPICVEPLDKIIEMRRYQVMGEARLPAEARPMIRDLEIYGDTQGKGVAHRADWAMHQGVPQMSQAPPLNGSDLDVLLWVGCAGAFHPRNQETSRAMVKILSAAGIGFAILGKEEICCGDPARRIGDEILFRKLARANIDRLNHYQVKKIVTMCPHCLNTLKNEYPELGCNLEVIHATEMVLQLIRDKRIVLKYPVADKMVVHDACYLGRYNQVYQQPRDICRSVPGVQLEEAERNRDKGFCCGGGGGRMWLHENIGQNINVVRAEEMANSGADMIGAACPYCLVMLDDGVKSLEMEKTPKVADIIDIVADAMG